MEHIKFTTQQELVLWLEHNYDQKESLWLVYPKKSSRIGDFDYSSIVDILLCYGWVDSLPRKVDDIFTGLRISPRNSKSNWSKVNKNKIARLEKSQRIHPNGYKLIAIAKENGCWDALNDVENLIIPKDMQVELSKQKLMEKWGEKSRSFKRGRLETLLNCKKQETRDKCISKIIEELS
jgi:uncharacterized protein YdeI (YjbR/CyaY-like superfamily)